MVSERVMGAPTRECRTKSGCGALRGPGAEARKKGGNVIKTHGSLYAPFFALEQQHSMKRANTQDMVNTCRKDVMREQKTHVGAYVYLEHRQ